ncbi:hypothetical protein [Clostridium sp. Cult3]|uniref:hypothetical protein n=1 Tax=Clostridium sp. Cult3 TaxID=2079004 RepID=UPI001F47C095|nr:hypothetical protein [Clostridium sp. Cult3]MCF6461320.1 hypothetical protein [Clostridium sp. Cult3]
MIVYEKGNLRIESDFEVRTFMENEFDVDLFIPTNFRTLNLYLEDLPDYIDSRIQLTEVKNIVLRFTTKEDNDYCTIHFLRNIDLQSAMINFVINYREHYIVLKDREYSGEMYIKRK